MFLEFLGRLQHCLQMWNALSLSKKKKKVSLSLSSVTGITSTVGIILNNSESESRSVVSDSLQPHGLCSPWNSPGQNTGVGSLSLLQDIFPTQGSNLGLPHCSQILSHLSHHGSLTETITLNGVTLE